MKTNEAKKYERLAVVRAKDAYFKLLEQLSVAEMDFSALPCRYRSDTGNLCQHTRHTMKKYPQHQPVAPLCSPNVCPRS